MNENSHLPINGIGESVFQKSATVKRSHHAGGRSRAGAREEAEGVGTSAVDVDIWTEPADSGATDVILGYQFKE